MDIGEVDLRIKEVDLRLKEDVEVKVVCVVAAGVVAVVAVAAAAAAIAPPSRSVRQARARPPLTVRRPPSAARPLAR
eukprot:8163929-Heterocapsa_arctica.AAC.1